MSDEHNPLDEVAYFSPPIGPYVPGPTIAYGSGGTKVRICQDELGAPCVAKIIKNTKIAIHESAVLYALQGTPQCTWPHLRQFIPFRSKKGKPRIALVMDYISGPSLLNVVRPFGYSGLPDQALALVARSILLAVSSLHHEGLAHMDIKPDNLMLLGTMPTPELYSQERLTFSLIDFDLAIPHRLMLQDVKSFGNLIFLAPEVFAMYDDSEVPSPSAPSSRTALAQSTEPAVFAGKVLNEVLYHSPPLALGEPKRSGPILVDSWSVGLVLFYAATGRIPFESSDNIAAVVLKMRDLCKDSQRMAEVEADEKIAVPGVHVDADSTSPGTAAAFRGVLRRMKRAGHVFVRSPLVSRSDFAPGPSEYLYPVIAGLLAPDPEQRLTPCQALYLLDFLRDSQQQAQQLHNCALCRSQLVRRESAVPDAMEQSIQMYEERLETLLQKI